MKLTLNEIERKAYMAGDKKLAQFVGYLIDAKSECECPLEEQFFIEDELFEDFHAA